MVNEQPEDFMMGLCLSLFGISPSPARYFKTKKEI